MIDPSLRTKLSYHLAQAHALELASSRCAIFAVKEQPSLSAEQVRMRQTMLRMNSQLLDNELELELDLITKLWLEHKRSGG